MGPVLVDVARASSALLGSGVVDAALAFAHVGPGVGPAAVVAGDPAIGAIRLVRRTRAHRAYRCPVTELADVAGLVQRWSGRLAARPPSHPSTRRPPRRPSSRRRGPCPG